VIVWLNGTFGAGKSAAGLVVDSTTRTPGQVAQIIATAAAGRG
jgi:hypothetical protein